TVDSYPARPVVRLRHQLNSTPFGHRAFHGRPKDTPLAGSLPPKTGPSPAGLPASAYWRCQPSPLIFRGRNLRNHAEPDTGTLVLRHLDLERRVRVLHRVHHLGPVMPLEPPLPHQDQPDVLAQDVGHDRVRRL